MLSSKENIYGGYRKKCGGNIGKYRTKNRMSCFCKSAVLPLPETGRRSIIGTTSLGSPISVHIGEIIRQNLSRSPLALSILTAVISPISVGISETAVLRPLFAPIKNESNIFTFLKNPNISIIKTNSGTIKLN